MRHVKFQICIASICAILSSACGEGKKVGDSPPPPRDELPKSPTDTSPEDNKAPGGAACLTGCNIPDEVQFSFIERRIDIKENCNVKKVEFIDDGQKFLAFHISDCGSGDQLYSTQISYGFGTDKSALLTEDCIANQGSTSDFDIAKFEGKHLAVSTCKSLSASSVAYGTLVDEVGTPILTRILFNASGDISALRAKWNGSAQAFGVSGRYPLNGGYTSSFRRFDRSLTLIGGTQTLAHITDFLAERDGQWFAVGRVDNTAKCTRISTSGLIGCSNVGTFLGNGRLSYFDGTLSVSGAFRLGSLNPLSCEFGLSPTAEIRSEAGLRDNISSFIFSDKYVGGLYLDQKNTFYLSILTRVPFAEVASIAVMDDDNKVLGRPLVADKHIVFPYASNGLMLLRRSDKPVP